MFDVSLWKYLKETWDNDFVDKLYLKGAVGRENKPPYVTLFGYSERESHLRTICEKNDFMYTIEIYFTTRSPFGFKPLSDLDGLLIDLGGTFFGESFDGESITDMNYKVTALLGRDSLRTAVRRGRRYSQSIRYGFSAHKELIIP